MSRRHITRRAFGGFLGTAVMAAGARAAPESEPTPKTSDSPLTVNWYHGAVSLRPVIQAYIEETGQQVLVTEDYDTFTTDVILVSDFQNLTVARKLGKFQLLASPLVDSVVPRRWRDRNGYWTGIALRTRVGMYNKAQVRRADIPQTWSDFTDSKWRGKLTIRSASNVYNRSLLALMIHHGGEESALRWARGIVANIGPNAEYRGDTGNAQAVGRGDFLVSFANSYYLGYERFRGTDLKSLDNVGVAWMEQTGTGQPVNVTGAGINKTTKKPAEARHLIEWLVSAKGQALLSQHVYKYPVRTDVQPSEFLRSFGRFKVDETNLNELEYRYDQADQIFEKSGWKAIW